MAKAGRPLPVQARDQVETVIPAKIRQSAWPRRGRVVLARADEVVE